MNRRNFLIGSLAALTIPKFVYARAAKTPASKMVSNEVDVELILAVDVSASIDEKEMALQFKGYEQAFRDPMTWTAISNGPLGKIACMLFIWSDKDTQIIEAPWALLDSRASMNQFADVISKITVSRHEYMHYGTFMAPAIDFATKQFGNKFVGTKRVLDVSGDGPCQFSGGPGPARDRAVAQGITINGLPILATQTPDEIKYQVMPLDEYYATKVIGGSESFIIPANGFEDFDNAISKKIYRELS